jgi:hypothetical protein
MGTRRGLAFTSERSKIGCGKEGGAGKSAWVIPLTIISPTRPQPPWAFSQRHRMALIRAAFGCEIATNRDPSQSRNKSLITRRNTPTGWVHG